MSSSNTKDPIEVLEPPLSGDVVDTSDFRSIDPESGVRRGLRTRHLSMMALAGIIGPGLLVGAGGALSNGGPASLLIGFGIIGIVAFSVMQSLGELTTMYPSGGAFTSLADRFVDPAFGVAVGWNYLLGVETFGEAEFWLALLKLVGLLAYYIFAIVYAAGGVEGADAVGFRYWGDPGAFVDGFRGVAAVFVFCATFYAGVEAATETKNPRVAIPLAIRQVFWRIIFIYMGAAFFFGLTCPANADGLQNGPSRALQSPMTIAIQNAGWYGGVHLINAFILVTCVSAINSSIYISSRTLLFMGQDRKAPKFLGWTDKRGVPIPAIVVANATGALSMMNVSTGAAEAYQYIVNLSGVSTFLVWGSISFIHIRFRKAWKLQGYHVEDLPFVSLFYPYNAYFGVAANIILALIQGWQTLAPFDAGSFVDAYILLVLFPIIYFGYKLVFKTRLWRVEEIDLQSGRRRDLEEAKEIAKGELKGFFATP
ncbi:putative general amino acid permease agp3 protein [Eutypa lata UCREL1]|uniref:Putative general amino acid permease agp3 protein n=1 Tax=Eutypa lata (strain UCR-EL1) TaxID=1287681 RepID=M7TC91_EUTLA|nr:putative general amino acid permease agp3 protein [Eutypa lata UCREL1]